MELSHWTSEIPEGELGTAKVERFCVSVEESRQTSIRRDYVPPGTYTRLRINGRLVMSDTPQEKRDHYEFLRRASGSVLINGLGLGCCLNVVIHKPEVDRVTVIELNPDVINLVGPHFEGVELIQADARTWRPPKGVRYDAVWHDIWPDMCLDYLPEMHTLHRRYGRRCDWQGSWSRSRLEYERRRYA